MMKNNLLPVLLMVMILTPSITGATTTKKATDNRRVEIIDSKSNQVQHLTEAEKLNRFYYYWSQKQPVKSSSQYQWRYQLTLHDQSGKSRWVYDPRGYLREVSMAKTTTVYQLNPSRAFNRFLVKE